MNAGSRKILLGTLIGAIAGVVATGPMTIAMILWHRRLPASQKYPLPPREITMKLARVSGLAEHMDEEARSAATLLAHFAYGGATGGAYGALSGGLQGADTLKGICFGMVVWIGSYLGWLPAMGVLHLATEHPARRNLLMIGAHVIWGATLGIVYRIFQHESRAVGPQPFSSRNLPHRDAN